MRQQPMNEWLVNEFDALCGGYSLICDNYFPGLKSVYDMVECMYLEGQHMTLVITRQSRLKL